MKKIILIGFALCMILAFSAPAMALDVDFSGYYRVRGFCYHDYRGFGQDVYNDEIVAYAPVPWEAEWQPVRVPIKGDEHSSDYFDMVLDVAIVFKVHPRLRLITNFTALDKVWGTADVGPGMNEDDRNMDWNRAYMEFDTGFGQFRVGRMAYGGFNHAFMDDGTDADAIHYRLNPKVWGGPSWNPLLFTFTYAKMLEADRSAWYGSSFSDEDIDQYRMTLGYFSNNFIIDNMIQFERNEFEFELPLATIDKADMWLYSLYGMMKFGIVKIEGEFAYIHGYITDPNYYDTSIPAWTGEMDDIEIDAMGWFIQTTLDLGMFEAYAGWAHTDGDNLLGTGPGDTLNNLPGQFGDFDILFFLTSSDGTHATNFGGLGNWSSDGNNPYGLDLLYIGGGFDITRDINISGVWGLARADTVPTGSKKVGWETNLWLTWQIMDGLQYKALFAFFDAGQFWEDAQNYTYSYADDGSCWALMHQLTLSF